MPRKGIVYYLESKHEPLVYIGSTLLTPATRLWQHKYGKETRGTSKLITRHGDAKITVLETFDDLSDDTKEARFELRQMEQYYLDVFKEDVVNYARAFEYDKEKQRKKWREYEARHKRKRNEKCMTYYNKHKDDDDYKERAKKRAKEWYAANKERAKENMKRYHEKKKDE